MSFVKLDIDNLEETKEKVIKAILKRENGIKKVEGTLDVIQAKAFKSRKLFAVDSGFNSAYDTSFVVFKAAVVNEDIEVDQTERIYLFYVDNYHTDRLKRLIMQQTLYEALIGKIEEDNANNSIVLVDGTITLLLFYPTINDRENYRNQFQHFYDDVYSPLIDQCQKRDILLLGFLKRTGSTYLAKRFGLSSIYDITILNSILSTNGQYVKPIPIMDQQSRRSNVHHDYVTFYLNLKSWNYRFELLKDQEHLFVECVENLLFWATDAYYGMNPVFSKADEHARVSKREANLRFNLIIHELPEKEQVRLRMNARKRTHFGFSYNIFPKNIMEGNGKF
jgi:hypothetical protein